MTDQEYNKAIDLLLGRNNELKVDYLNFHQMEVIRFMEKEMPEVLDNYLQYIWVECRENSFIRTLDKSIDLRNLIDYLWEHPEWGEEICTENNRLLDCCQDRDECRLQMGKMGSSTEKTCLGKVLSDWAREEEGK